MGTESAGRTNASILKKNFCRFCHFLYERHLVSGVGGNVSARSADKIFLTPSGYSLRDVEPDVVVTVNNKGEVLEGGTPTKDTNMHLGILRAKPDANVVCHVHGAYIIAATTMLTPGPDTLPPLTPGFVYYAYPLPMVPFLVPGSEVLAKTVAREFSNEKCRALFLQNHGLVTVGKDFQEALNVAEEIDEAARIFVLTDRKAKAIPSKDLDRIG
ncbi:MAG: class II aldolase/adducin family protein [Deltaproteobacteria bacterium]|nr:class II aldolase/adducin family protein [Deltaproteobacteria bacterium]MBW1910175.1 class II aldolase/adducin family protein [Deltaproteobacteria bacterium]MBW2034106.1 class II aldolase/adducin family protein [Deltaproteobacteria bacterium]MBW2115475.1 class II aldolase/adducin family protein [Deltaproteobacteria bacterium]MBW2168087.1 class II aldolase/adducin family protein [Deltaproteobacteria bacterium]